MSQTYLNIDDAQNTILNPTKLNDLKRVNLWIYNIYFNNSNNINNHNNKYPLQIPNLLLA